MLLQNKRRKTPCQFPFALLPFLLVMSLPSTGSADGFIKELPLSPLPSTPGKTFVIHTYYSCHDIRSKDPLKCTFASDLMGLAPGDNPDVNGGHFHNGDRPFTLNNTPIEFAFDMDPTPLGVSGFTINGAETSAHLTRSVPEVGGKLLSLSLLVSPPGWACVSQCFTRISWSFIETDDIGFPSLIELPEDDPFIPAYEKVRTKEVEHPDSVAFYGAPLTLEVLPAIALVYLLLSDRKLSVNDISLPKGGLFDIAHDWKPKPGHDTHREGKDVDINQENIKCENDHDLKLAVNQLLLKVKLPSGRKRSSLYCESGGRKHIDFES